MIVRANVNTPWARRGETFEVESLDASQQWHRTKGYLTVEDAIEPPPPKPKKRAATPVVVPEEVVVDPEPEDVESS